MTKAVLFTFLLLGFSIVAKADSWSLPTPTKYCSANKKFCLKVDPKKLNSQLSYFQDKVDDKENAGAVKNLKDNYCKGTFLSKGNKLWNIRLDNEVSPVRALVSDSGDYVITFDNWHGVGYGDNVVAIYDGTTGRLIKKLGLSDFLTESDIYNLPASTSSIQWHGTHQIDYDKKQLVLKVVKPSKDKVFFDVHVDLRDGKVLDEVVDRIPSLQFLLSSKDVEGSSPIFPFKGEQLVCEFSDAVTQISTVEMANRIMSKELPEYPPAAKAVRAIGESVLEVVVSEQGDVRCIKPVSGHPLLRAAITNSIKKWKFEKSSTPYKGNIIIEGKFALILNGKVIE